MGSEMCIRDRWWVSDSWGKGSVTASSTHISGFAALRDTTPPVIGAPCWTLEPPIGPRLSIPISDVGSGLGKVKATLDREELLFEKQAAWSRLLYRPQGGVKQGSHALWVSVKDKAGHLTERSMSLTWPPLDDERCSPDRQQDLTP